MRIKVPASIIKDVSKFLRDDDQLLFNTLMCLSGVALSKRRMSWEWLIICTPPIWGTAWQ
jgi:hypothetical protein